MTPRLVTRDGPLFFRANFQDEDWQKSTCPNKNGLVHVLGEAAKFDSQVDISGVNYIAGWWYTYPPEKYELVRLDHHPNY